MRLLALTFLSIYIFSTTQFHELLKFPALVEHFSEHKEETPNISLWQFLCIHYAHGEVKDKDYEKDMKLPFKSHDNCGSYTFITLLPENKYCLDKTTITAWTKQNECLYNLIIIDNDSRNIWQPPKIS